MSEERVLMIFAERRAFLIDEDREERVWLERRIFHVQDDERELEVYLT